MTSSKPRGRVLNSDQARLDDVDRKQARVSRLLEGIGCDALLLQRPGNIAWFTAGGDVERAACEMSAAVFITKEARVVVTNNVDAPQLFERELFGLGFQLKQRAWHESHEALIDDLCRGRKVASDSGYAGTQQVEDSLRGLRLRLTQLEAERLRRLSRVAAHAVEATARTVYAGQSEAEIAGEVAHRLIKRTVQPERVRVVADGRSERYRRWTYGSDPVHSYAVISCVARRWGLCTAVTRTVSLEPVSAELEAAHRKAMLMHATGMFFSRDGETLGTVWPRVQRIYEKFDLPHEWQLADQADVIGYEPVEVQLTPGSNFPISAPLALHWHPSVGPAMAGDTILVGPDDVEFLTRSREWPRLTVEVKGHAVQCPDIYVVPAGSNEDLAETTFDALPASRPAQTSLFDPADSSTDLSDSIWEMDAASVLDDDDSVH